MKAILETTGKKINNREHISKETSVNITSSFNSLSEAGTNLNNFDTDSNRNRNRTTELQRAHLLCCFRQFLNICVGDAVKDALSRYLQRS